MFFNIGGGEILVIAMVALIAVGPEQLPSVLRKAGKAMAQVRAMTTGLRDEFMSGIDEVTEIAKPEAWMGKGTSDDPVVPAGYAERQKAAEQAAKEEADPGSSTSTDASSDSSNGDSSNGGSSNGDGPVINQIAQANARSAEDLDRPKPSIGGRSTAAPRPAEDEVDDASSADVDVDSPSEATSTKADQDVADQDVADTVSDGGAEDDGEDR